MSFFGIPIRNGIGIGLRSYVGLESKAPAWTPYLIPTALWLDANDTSTITLNGSTVSQWNDKSGNGRNAVQATAANQPGWGRGRNLLLWSEQFQQSAWAKEGMAIGQDAILAPNNTLTADKIVPNSTAGVSHVVFNATAVAVVNGVAIWTVRAKAGEYNFITVGCAVPAGRYTATFNLTTGAVTKTATAGTPTDTSNSAIDLGNGWWQLSVTATTTSATSSYIFLGASASGTPTQEPTALNVLDAGDGVSGVFIWGAQLNPGTTADPYQQTTSAAHTITIGLNGKPAVTFDGTTDWMSSTLIANATAETIAVALNRTGTPPFPDSSTILAASASPTGGRHFRFNTSGTLSFIRQSQAVVATSTSVAPTNKSAIVEMTYDNSTAAFYANGVPIGQSAVSPNLVATTTIIGTQPVYFTEFFAGQMAEIIVCQTVLSTGDRQRLEGYLAWKWGGV